MSAELRVYLKDLFQLGNLCYRIGKMGLDLLSDKEKHMYLFFDTETTGIPKNRKAPISDSTNWPRLVQLAWLITDEKAPNRRVRSISLSHRDL